jgi:hypothetical protein
VKIEILLILFSVISILSSETLLINKTDGTNLQFEVEEIIDMTFNDVFNESIQIHKTDASTDEIEIALIENIEFTQTPVEIMFIYKIDGTIYEIETALIENISFNITTSIDNTFELSSAISIGFLNNSPNPFNPSTTISFELNEPGFTKIEIFNIKGEKIETVLEATLTIGLHEVNWCGIDNTNKISSSGIYFYKISVNGKQKFSKMLLLK